MRNFTARRHHMAGAPARRLVGALLSASLLALGLLAGGAAQAGHPKIAHDLQSDIDAAGPRKAAHVRDVNGQRYLQAVIATDGRDPEMTDLRAAVLRGGGSVLVRHSGLHALTVLIKAGAAEALAQRPDVLSVVPNRQTLRTASKLEAITGALTANVRPTSSKTGYSGLDGSGIGIAVLDSGVMTTHKAFQNTQQGETRVRRNVSMLNTAQANWAGGLDASTSLQPGSAALGSYEAALANDNNLVQDAYGHGTHVASVAAGVARGYSSGTPDTTGIAPNANVYDVKVLGNLGTGTLSDALEGIQWVIYHAKEYNIRVMNLSLATSSTQSWKNDPLCAAVRSATAAGITVVVAAGNFGQSMLWQEVYGGISSPGNDPSVITVGAVNFKGTTARADDSVTDFSSRGPSRGAWTDAQGVRQVDNLLKPDLVAPGNKVIGAAATSATPAYTWDLLGSSYASLL